jgi:hypothetical protein
MRTDNARDLGQSGYFIVRADDNNRMLFGLASVLVEHWMDDNSSLTNGHWLLPALPLVWFILQPRGLTINLAQFQ